MPAVLHGLHRQTPACCRPYSRGYFAPRWDRGQCERHLVCPARSASVRASFCPPQRAELATRKADERRATGIGHGARQASVAGHPGHVQRFPADTARMGYEGRCRLGREANRQAAMRACRRSMAATRWHPLAEPLTSRDRDWWARRASDSAVSDGRTQTCRCTPPRFSIPIHAQGWLATVSRRRDGQAVIHGLQAYLGPARWRIRTQVRRPCQHRASRIRTAPPITVWPQRRGFPRVLRPFLLKGRWLA